MATPVLRGARDLLREGPERATREVTIPHIGWKGPKDRSLMDQVRVEVLDMPGRLSGAGL